MTRDQVRVALGSPLETTDADDLSMWRYFERANPRRCDSGSSSATPPEYSIEATLIFRAGVLAMKSVKHSGSPIFP
jgi:outer membrane protein assembly factor BamE (lipoprotein component of BamABCDE complex)